MLIRAAEVNRRSQPVSPLYEHGKTDCDKADTSSTSPNTQGAQRVNDASSQSTSSSFSASNGPPSSTRALDLRAQAANAPDKPLIRRTKVPSRGRDGPGGNVKGREGMGPRTGRTPYNNSNSSNRSGPQRYRPNRTQRTAPKGREDDEGSNNKGDGTIPNVKLLSEMEIQHLINQRDKYHGRPQPVKPTVGIEYDADYFKEVPESGALIRGRDEKWRNVATKDASAAGSATHSTTENKDQSESRDADHESSVNAAEALVTARLRLVANTASTRYTTRLASRLLSGHYIELFDQKGHVDRVLEAAHEERAFRRKKKQTKAAAAADAAKLEELASASDAELNLPSFDASAADKNGKKDDSSDNSISVKSSIAARAVHKINDPRDRWRPAAFAPLGLPEIDFLTRELVRGEYDAQAADVNASASASGSGSGSGNTSAMTQASKSANASVSANASASSKPKERPTDLPKSGLESNGIFKEAARQAVLNGTYLPKDVKAFTSTLERILGSGPA